MTLNIGKELAALQRLTIQELRARYAEAFGETTNASNRAWLVKRITWRLQALAEGDLSERAKRRAAELANDADLRLTPPKVKAAPTAPTEATGRTVTVMLGDKADERLPLPGTIITREYKGGVVQVKVLANGFEFEGEVYKSLVRRRQGGHRAALQWLRLFPPCEASELMNKPRQDPCPPSHSAAPSTRASLRRRAWSRSSTPSTPSGSAARRTSRARHEGWQCLPDRYDDGGFSGGNMDRPALKRLLADIEAGKIDCVVVYKVDRLSRSLLDFARMMEVFDRHGVSFVSVTQQINSATSMGRLMLNVLLSFAQFEREIIGERTRDKIAAARRKGKWAGGHPLLGYDVDPKGFKLVVNADEAVRVRAIFELYLELEGLVSVVEELDRRGWMTKRWTTRKGQVRGGRPFTKTNLHQLLTNITYLGKVKHKAEHARRRARRHH